MTDPVSDFLDALGAAESIGALLAAPLPLGPETRSAEPGTDFADIAPAEVAARIAQAGRDRHV